MKTVQVTNLDPTQTVTCLPYLRVGTEALAAIQSPELQGIPPLKPAILQLNVRNLSALELRGTTDGIGAQVQVTIV